MYQRLIPLYQSTDRGGMGLYGFFRWVGPVRGSNHRPCAGHRRLLPVHYTRPVNLSFFTQKELIVVCVFFLPMNMSDIYWSNQQLSNQQLTERRRSDFFWRGFLAKGATDFAQLKICFHVLKPASVAFENFSLFFSKNSNGISDATELTFVLALLSLEPELRHAYNICLGTPCGSYLVLVSRVIGGRIEERCGEFR